MLSQEGTWPVSMCPSPGVWDVIELNGFMDFPITRPEELWLAVEAGLSRV